MASLPATAGLRGALARLPAVSRLRGALACSALVAFGPALAADAAPSADRVIKSRLDGAFYGWDGDTVFPLANGQVWRQKDPGYRYHYAYRPKVLIWRARDGYRMLVEGVNTPLAVEELPPSLWRSLRAGTPGPGGPMYARDGWWLGIGSGYAVTPVSGPVIEYRLGFKGVSFGPAVATGQSGLFTVAAVRSHIVEDGPLTSYGELGFAMLSQFESALRQSSADRAAVSLAELFVTGYWAGLGLEYSLARYFVLGPSVGLLFFPSSGTPRWVVSLRAGLKVP